MDYGKTELVTKKIRVYGIVQGVGFRPLVYRIAQNLGIKGSVRNVGGFVEIIASSKHEDFERFLKQIKEDQSSGCEIIRLETEDVPYIEFDRFIIIDSRKSRKVSILPPDLPVCSACEEELKERSDRRYNNPFISCISCGPRYTIMEELPYDRHTTTMRDYKMCSACAEEYRSPKSRRFHAQTISCNDCGPHLIYQEKTEVANNKAKDTNKALFGDKDIDKALDEFYNEEAFVKAVSTILRGGIIAVKGIGGYHFVCSPFLEETVQNLRKLKGREEKPFAVMFPSITEIYEFCKVSEEEAALLKTKARPIVLLSLHRDTMAPSTNKGSIYCGAFLPYTPLQLLLAIQCGPLIMTSANISDQPTIRRDEKILSLESHYLQGVLFHTRRILRTVDDSVAKIIDGKPQLIRRSRGFVPYPVFLNQDELITKNNSGSTDINLNCSKTRKKVIFAAGGDLKAAFCIYQDGRAVLSQYFGDLEEVSIQEEYKNSYADLTALLSLEPSLAVGDLHPNYHSSHFAASLGIPHLLVQHHHAHIASVIAEHNLQGRVIGISFDGTGYGTDGCIWGSEFMICEGADYIRTAHLSYTPMLGGDQSMKDAKKTASCYLFHYGLEEYVEDDRHEVIKSAVNNKVNIVQTSSMGRLFDAAASILDIAHKNQYEGECATLLEKEALLAIKNKVKPEELMFAFSEKNEIIEINPKPVLEELCRLRGSRNIPSLALGFHYAIAKAVGEVCDRLKIGYSTDTVALSGGVFQNTVLTEQVLKILRRKGFKVYLNMAVPPNDGGISLGQTYIALHQ